MIDQITLNQMRSRPQSTKLYLSIYKPQTIFTARINDSNIARGTRTITYDNAVGNWQNIKSGMTLLIGSTAGARDIGYLRIRSATSSTIVVAENGDIAWADNLYLTVKNMWDIWGVYPRIIQSGEEDVVFYKDYNIEYSNQNSVLGSFVCAGPHRAAFLNNGSASIYWSATGTINLRGNSVTYEWDFGGAYGTTGSNAMTPGYITYNTPGHYVTRLTVTGTGGEIDTTYRYVSIYDRPSVGTSTPILQWGMDEDLSGSRSEGGYTSSITVWENIDDVVDGAVVILFGDSYYAGNQQSLNNNNSDVFFVGYILGSTIQYDYNTKSCTFQVGSITEYTKSIEGFSISIESVDVASTWYEMDDLDWKRAIYHYLRWHTSMLYSTDFRWIANNKKVQYFDADRGSLFDAINSFLKSAALASAVADRQGVVWIEEDAQSNYYSTPSVNMIIEKQDYIGEPNIRENFYNPVSFIEMGGIAFSGISTGTYSPILAGAPNATTPGYRGSSQRISGLSVENQDDLNRIVGMTYKNRNAKYPNVDYRLQSWYPKIDIAPQYLYQLNVQPTDNNRGATITGSYVPERLEYSYTPRKELLTARLSLNVVDKNYLVGETIPIPPAPKEEGYSQPEFVFPEIPAINFPTFNFNAAHMLCIGSNVAVTLEPGTSSSVVPMTDSLHGVGHVGYMSKSGNSIVINRQGLYHVSFLLDWASSSSSIPYSGEILAYVTKPNDPYAGGGVNAHALKCAFYIKSNTNNVTMIPATLQAQGYMWCNIGEAITCYWSNATNSFTVTYITKLFVSYVGSGVVTA